MESITIEVTTVVRFVISALVVKRRYFYLLRPGRSGGKQNILPQGSEVPPIHPRRPQATTPEHAVGTWSASGVTAKWKEPCRVHPPHKWHILPWDYGVTDLSLFEVVR
jgi:hypothetical protein